MHARAVAAGATLAGALVATAAKRARRAGPSEEIAAVIAATNAMRGRRAKLRYDPALSRAAQGWAEQMAAGAEFTHGDWVARLRRAGVKDPGGENIAHGQDSPAEAVAAWMASPAHRRNILHASYRRIGVGHAGVFWVQDFGY